MGKGDTYRKVNWAAYSANYDRIFGAKPQKEVNDEQGCNKVSQNEEVVQNQMVESSAEPKVQSNY